MIDLPHFAALVMGLEDWETVHAELVTEEGAAARGEDAVGAQVHEPRLSPTEPDTQAPLAGPPIGVPVMPSAMVPLPTLDHLGTTQLGPVRPKDRSVPPERARYVHVNSNSAIGAPPTVLPARFQIACTHGHIDDFPWLRCEHQSTMNCVGRSSC